jgi:hypothetical protein
MNSDGAAAASTSEKPEAPKTLWDRVLTSTPVVMTVLATLLAGLSSSEMTQAQYYRSQAAQDQSKAGDQWSFFQAKRVRETLLRGQLQSLADHGEFQPAAWGEFAGRLPENVRKTSQDAEALLQALEKARAELGPTYEPLKKAAEKIRQTAVDRAPRAAALEKAVSALVGSAAVTDLFPDSSTGQTSPLAASAKDPRAILNGLLEPINPELPVLLKGLAERQPEGELAPRLAKVKPAQLQQAIEAAEARAVEFEKASDPTGKTLDEINKVMRDQQELLGPFSRSVQRINVLLASVPSSESKNLAEVRSAGAALTRNAANLQTTARELEDDFQAARLGFDARRYRDEGRFNQGIAGLYELQVRQVSVSSDKHRHRSKFFFYSMLAAQAGVTIGTLALAVRQRSVFWGLATCAGVIALLIGAYVYLFI